MPESPASNSRLAMDYRIRQCHRALDADGWVRHEFPKSQHWRSWRSRSDWRADCLANAVDSNDWAQWVYMQWRLDDPLSW